MISKEEEKEIKERPDLLLINYLCIISSRIGGLEAIHEYRASQSDKERQTIAKDELLIRLESRAFL